MLHGQKVILTGANSGIGLEVLKLLAEEKSNQIFAVDLHNDKIAEFGENVFPWQCDVSSKENIDAFFKATVDKMGNVTIFYANAGYPYYEAVDYVNWDRAKRIFETNVFSPIYSYEKYRAYLKGRKGHFAVTISAMGKMAMPGYALYTATKFAMHGFQQGIRLEMPDNMKMTCLYPIATATNFFKVANKEGFEKPFPVQRADIVAKKMLKGLEKGKKSVSPSILFSVCLFLFAVLPFIKTIYLKTEKSKFIKFLGNREKQ